LATYARPGDTYRFYEINPQVEQMAEEYFTYLRDARQREATVEMVMGDARLSLEREEPQNFDLLVLDAFSGDSVPAHLLTREAMDIYLKHLAPGGVIAVHSTNSYLYLAPVVRALAAYCQLETRRVYTVKDPDREVFRSDWMLLTTNPKFLAAVPNVPPPPRFKDDFEVPLWTDHYNNLFQILQ
jgi:spermidine synthase